MKLRLSTPIAVKGLSVLDISLWVETRQTFVSIAGYFWHNIE